MYNNEQIEEYNEEGQGIQIPECCREGWEDCPHSVEYKLRQLPKKRINEGL